VRTDKYGPLWVFRKAEIVHLLDEEDIALLVLAHA